MLENICSRQILMKNYPACKELTDILLSCHSRVTVTSCFVYKVIRDLESIDQLCRDLCINPIRK